MVKKRFIRLKAPVDIGDSAPHKLDWVDVEDVDLAPQLPPEYAVRYERVKRAKIESEARGVASPYSRVSQAINSTGDRLNLRIYYDIQDWIFRNERAMNITRCANDLEISDSTVRRYYRRYFSGFPLRAQYRPKGACSRDIAERIEEYVRKHGFDFCRAHAVRELGVSRPTLRNHLKRLKANDANA